MEPLVCSTDSAILEFAAELYIAILKFRPVEVSLSTQAPILVAVPFSLILNTVPEM